MALGTKLVMRFTAGSFTWPDPSTWSALALGTTLAVSGYSGGAIIALVGGAPSQLYLNVVNANDSTTPVIEFTFIGDSALTTDIESAEAVLWGGCQDATIRTSLANFSSVGGEDILANSVFITQWGSNMSAS